MTFARPLATVAVFSVLPLAVFASENRNELDLTLNVLLIPAALLGAGLVAVLAARRRGGPRAAEAAAVVFAAATFVLFQYAGVRDLAGGTAAALVAWAALLAIALVLAVRLARHPMAWNWVLAVGAALTAINALQYATYEAPDGPTTTRRALPVAAAHAGKGGPDVYFFLLDGYSRADELKRLTGYDNAPFLADLRHRGFDVASHALTAYPLTPASLSSTLSLQYVVPGDAWPVLQGDNAAVASLRRLGYVYVHAADYGKDHCAGREDLCIDPAGKRGSVLGQSERAFLEATPLAPLLPVGFSRVGARPGVLEPDKIVEEVQARRDDRPVFVWSHLMTPHPPYRYRRDCSIRAAFDGDLDAWGEARAAGGRGYTDTIRCTNRAVLRAVARITRADRDALIFVQGDHGSSFGLNWRKPVQGWPDADLQQRYPILSAARLPARCRDRRAPEVPVNTFRLVLSCLTGETVPPLPGRHFALGYDDGERPVPLAGGRLQPR